ncbi:hypothetical protein LCGC14_1153630 [marine sediment metagenome]|uniref:Uncharacterized protein n=1 Tax=marine sediment metagenome TaxID=412755 RepID=A0A0F9LZN4_9ZZZZ
MQWLIDTIIAQLIQKTGFVERTPPASPDWELGDLTPAGVFNVQDASGIVPAGTKAILCRLNAKASASGRQIFLTTEDESSWFAMAQLRLIYANRDQTTDKIVFLTDALTFKTNLSTSSWAYIKLTIAGYWLTEVWQNGFYNRGDPALADFLIPDLIIDGNYHTLDLSGIIPASTTAVALMVEVASSTSSHAVYFRSSNNVNTKNESKCLVIDPGYTAGYDITVPTKGLQNIAYRVRSGAWAIITITVKGWWF